MVYRYTDAKGREVEERARATERDRAQAGKFEALVVPAGRFGAHRIEWLSRVAIKSEGRPVLAYLTTEPYRKETMWLAPGIGIIRRNIVYILDGKVKHTIQFNLLNYEAAEDCVREDVEMDSIKYQPTQ